MARAVETAVEEKSHQSKIFGFPSDRTTYKNWQGDEQGDAAGYQPILGPRLQRGSGHKPQTKCMHLCDQIYLPSAWCLVCATQNRDSLALQSLAVLPQPSDSWVRAVTPGRPTASTPRHAAPGSTADRSDPGHAQPRLPWPSP